MSVVSSFYKSFVFEDDITDVGTRPARRGRRRGGEMVDDDVDDDVDVIYRSNSVVFAGYIVACISLLSARSFELSFEYKHLFIFSSTSISSSSDIWTIFIFSVHFQFIFSLSNNMMAAIRGGKKARY